MIHAPDATDEASWGGRTEFLGTTRPDAAVMIQARMATGSVTSLQRWPVKSMAGESVGALCLDPLGAVGDRSHALFDVFKGAPRRINAETVPRLLAWSAAYPGVDNDALERATLPQPTVTAPDGAVRRWDDPALPAALADDLGREVTLVCEPRGQQDRPATLHVTVGASLRAVADALGEAVDARRFRSNLHLELDAEPYAEETWLGRRLRVGQAELEIVDCCRRCAIPTRDPDTQRKWPALLRWLAAERATTFGVIVRATAPAVVRHGDGVTLL